MEGLRGKNALVTGATSGIGQAIAIRLAQEGVNVALNYRRTPDSIAETETLVSQACGEICGCGVEALPVQGDVSQEEDVERLFQDVISKFGHLDILVNNAGVQQQCPSHELSVEDFDWVMGVNLRGAFLCARETLKHLLSRQATGSIINISSVHEYIPKPAYLGYAISKGGMQSMTRTLALEYADRGIRVNGVGPGATVTPINQAWVDDPVQRAMIASHIPMGRPGEAAEMAAAVAFLASEDAAYITGQTLFVDGGLTLFADFQENWSS